MNTLALMTLAITALSSSATKYGYGSDDYNDYGSSSSDSSSSSELALPVRLPEGNYYICTHKGNAYSKRCLTCLEAPDASESSSDDDDDCADSSSSSSSSDAKAAYVHEPRYRFVYASSIEASLFTITYPNASATSFNLRCKSCASDHHRDTVSIVGNHLEFQSHPVQTLGEFQAWPVKDSITSVYIKAPSKTDLKKWWEVSMLRKRIKLGLRFTRHWFQLYAAKNGYPTKLIDSPPTRV